MGHHRYVGEHGGTRRGRRRRGASVVAAGTPAAAPTVPPVPTVPTVPTVPATSTPPSPPVPGPDAAPGGAVVPPPSDNATESADEHRPGPPRAKRKPRPRDPAERSLRDLVGAG